MEEKSPEICQKSTRNSPEIHQKSTRNVLGLADMFSVNFPPEKRLTGADIPHSNHTQDRDNTKLEQEWESKNVSTTVTKDNAFLPAKIVS